MSEEQPTYLLTQRTYTEVEFVGARIEYKPCNKCGVNCPIDTFLNYSRQDTGQERPITEEEIKISAEDLPLEVIVNQVQKARYGFAPRITVNCKIGLEEAFPETEKNTGVAVRIVRHGGVVFQATE